MSEVVGKVEPIGTAEVGKAVFVIERQPVSERVVCKGCVFRTVPECPNVLRTHPCRTEAGNHVFVLREVRV